MRKKFRLFATKKRFFIFFSLFLGLVSFGIYVFNIQFKACLHEIFVKSAWANEERGLAETVKESLEKIGHPVVPWNDCDGKADNGAYCMGSFAFTCINGIRYNIAFCEINKTCKGGVCVCLRDTCSGGRTINPENCNCDCPSDKPLWTGSKCVKKECESPSDCVGWFSSADERCMSCDNGLCSVKATKTPSRSGYAFCTNDNQAHTCNEDGSLGKIFYPCSEDFDCVDGHCTSYICCDGQCKHPDVCACESQKDYKIDVTGHCCPVGSIWIDE